MYQVARPTLGLVVVVICLTTLGLWAQPQTVQTGGRTLHLKSQATRSEMFGLVDLYEVALYAPQEVSSVEMLRGADTPKALRIQIRYNGSLPDRIPADWRTELQPALGDQQSTMLRKAYAHLQPNDEIQITYVPDAGTTLSVSGMPVLTEVEYDLMAAFLDIWLGQTPVSEQVKSELASF
jgi:hypothetical protein